MRRPALAILVGSLLVACADLLGFQDLHQADSGTDSGGDALPPDAGADVDPCTHAKWPDPPSVDDPGGDPDAGGAGGFVFAIRHVFFTGDPDAGVTTFGYDLDKRCTTSKSTTSCNPPSQSDPTTVKDGPGGIDSESTQLFGQLQQFVPSLTNQAFDDEVAAGDFTVLLRLFQYKGIANQTLTSGMFALQGSPGSLATPAFDGNDTWVVADDDTLGGITQVPKKRAAAYVRNNTLVAIYPGTVSLRVLLPSTGSVTGPLPVALSQPTLTATLVKRGDGRYDMTNGVIVGRWSTTDMLAAIASLTTNNQPLCTFANGAVYSSVADTICQERDIFNDPIQDNGDSNCDSVSVAIAFDAVAAGYGSSATFPVSLTPCPIEAGTCPQ